MSLCRVKAGSPLERIREILEDEGGVILEGLYSSELIESMRDAFLLASEKMTAGAATQGLGPPGNAFVGKNTIRFSSLGKITPKYFEMLDNSIFQSIADSLLLPHCSSYWVNTGQVMLIGPGSKAQPLHRDCLNWPEVVLPNWPKGPEVTVSSMVALDVITEELGATRVIPGSHRWPEAEQRIDPDLTVPAEMAPGDALVYSGQLVHGGGANRTSGSWRRAMHLSFVAGWLTPEESSPIDYTDEELVGQSERVKRLLGHRSYFPHSPLSGGLWLRDAKGI